MKLAKENIHFVVGMSRAGTTWMTKCLNTHSACSAFGETLFWGRLYRSPDKKGKYTKAEVNDLLCTLQSMRIHPRSNDYGSLAKITIEDWSLRLVDELTNKDISTPEELFHSLCEFIAKREQKEFVVEKSPHHLNWIKRIKHSYPNSKYIVMIREPYGFILSYKYQGLQSGDIIRKIYEKQYHPIQAALVWRGYSRSVIKAQVSYKNDILIIRNEDLRNNSRDILTNVASFLNLPNDKEFGQNLPPKFNSSIRNDKKLELDSADLFWINLLARNEIAKLGYSVRQNKLSYIKIGLSILSLPVWVIRTIILLRSNSKANLFQYLLNWVK